MSEQRGLIFEPFLKGIVVLLSWGDGVEALNVEVFKGDLSSCDSSVPYGCPGCCGHRLKAEVYCPQANCLL